MIFRAEEGVSSSHSNPRMSVVGRSSRALTGPETDDFLRLWMQLLEADQEPTTNMAEESFIQNCALPEDYDGDQSDFDRCSAW